MRELRRHPNSFLLFRSVFDAVFAVLVLVQVGAQIRAQAGDRNAFGCHDCLPLSLITQFVLLGSELVLLMLSIDLLTSLTNPFTNYRANQRTLTGVTLVRTGLIVPGGGGGGVASSSNLVLLLPQIVSVLVAVVLGLLHPGGVPAVGLTQYNLCWIRFKVSWFGWLLGPPSARSHMMS